MNAEEFDEINWYFEQSMNLIVYSYSQLKQYKTEHPYSRAAIHQETKNAQESEASHNEIEDYLRNDLVNNYLKKLRHFFLLTNFSIQPGSEESKKNVKTGIVDIRFEYISATSMDGTSFIFECKRLDKYSGSQKGYIEKEMMRFVNRQYYPESRMKIAGMLAFVEIDLEKNPRGYLPVDGVAHRLRQKINSAKEALKVSDRFTPFKLFHEEYNEISNFNYCYLSKHRRPLDGQEVSIYHLLLDYYKILVT